jgi:hypothetical protein
LTTPENVPPGHCVEADRKVGPDDHDMPIADPMDGPDPMDDASRCTATSKQTGERCRLNPVPGSAVCRFHGGAAPQTQAAARRRLLEAADPAAARLILESQTAEKASDRIRATVEVLDRAGVSRLTSEDAAKLESDQVRHIAEMLRTAMDRAAIPFAQQRTVIEHLGDVAQEIDQIAG